MRRFWLSDHSITAILRHGIFQSLEGIDNSIASGEENQGVAIHFAERGRRPGAVKDVGSHLFVVAGEEKTGAFVEHDQAGCVRRADTFMCVVHAGAGVQIEMVAVNKN